MVKTRKCIELFAGAGGLALGLEQAGFEEVGLVEFDHTACETLRINRPNWNILEEDVVEVSKRDLLKDSKKNYKFIKKNKRKKERNEKKENLWFWKNSNNNFMKYGYKNVRIVWLFV